MKKSSLRRLCFACGFLVACGGATASSPKTSVPRGGAEAEAPLVIPPMADAGGGVGDIRQELVETTEPVTITSNEATGTSMITARDPRLASRKPRSRAHVLTEVQALERQLNGMKPEASDRALVRRRIAEGYNDLAMTASGADADRARTESIKQYTAIVNDHPNAAQKDEVLYYLALALELTGDTRNARTTYFELIRQFPQSQFVPLAYFAFGEMFFREALADPPKNDLALQAFSEVLKHPPQSSPIVADTLLRMGEVHQRKGEREKAKASFARLAREFPSSTAATRIPASGP